MKLTTNIGLVTCFLLIAISCTKENTISHSSEVANSTSKIAGFTIGQRYGGGVIFYIDSTGQHGLIADTVDLKPLAWWNGVYTGTGATATGIGKGFLNTRKIVRSQGDSGHYAARRCFHYRGSGYKDWFLSSRDELNELYKQKNVVGGFTNDGYWSSSQIHYYRAWVKGFEYGAQWTFDKSVTFSIRAIRAF